MVIPSEVERRFWAKVDRRGDDECWPWRASRTPRGYGFFALGIPGLPRLGRAHRVAGVLGGKLKAIVASPDDLALHSCDQPSCCNPDHIRSGTQADNIRDKHLRGRAAPQGGEANPAAKLTDLEVWAILELAARTKLSQRIIAGVFGVSAHYVWMLVNGCAKRAAAV